MATVWAHFSGTASVVGLGNLGRLDEVPIQGWSHVHNFATFHELVAWLRGRNLYGRVTRLNVNCHGAPGTLFLDFTVNVGNATSLNALGVYLQPGAKLIFTGCTAGQDAAGSLLLTKLSELHWGRTVIGFELVSILGNPRGTMPLAGDVIFGGGASQGLLVRSGAVAARTKDPRLTAWSRHAKWAYRGTVIRYPAFEQARRPTRRCANPACNGHREFWDQCPGDWNPGCEW